MVVWALNRVSLKDEFKNEDGYVALPERSQYLNLTGEAHSDLRPSGTIRLTMEGKPVFLDCISNGDYIEKGKKIKVVALQGPSLVVESQNS